MAQLIEIYIHLDYSYEKNDYLRDHQCNGNLGKSKIYKLDK